MITLESFVLLCQKILRLPDDEKCIKVEWRVGGQGGGSCWDDGETDRHYPLDADPEEELTELDKILEIFAPNLTFLQYKKLTREVVTRGSRTQNDYYGNYTSYASKSVNLEVLYRFIKIDPTAVMIVGLPGSGKTTLAKTLGGTLFDDPVELGSLVSCTDPLIVVTDPNMTRPDLREAASKVLGHRNLACGSSSRMIRIPARRTSLSARNAVRILRM